METTHSDIEETETETVDAEAALESEPAAEPTAEVAEVTGAQEAEAVAPIEDAPVATDVNDAAPMDAEGTAPEPVAQAEAVEVSEAEDSASSEEPPQETSDAEASPVDEDRDGDDAEPQAAGEDEGEDAVDSYDETAIPPTERMGDWFVIHTYAGYENKVKANLMSRIS